MSPLAPSSTADSEAPLAVRVADIVEQYGFGHIAMHVHLQATTRVRNLLAHNPHLPDTVVLAVLYREINPMADWNQEND